MTYTDGQKRLELRQARKDKRQFKEQTIKAIIEFVMKQRTTQGDLMLQM